MTSARQRTGARAEDLVASYLEQRGFVVLLRNWRRPEAELDIVARDGDTCVFVEVRSRTGVDRGHPLESLDTRKRARIVRGARLLVRDGDAAKLGPFSGYRFDAAGVTFDESGAVATLDYVANAFDTNG